MVLTTAATVVVVATAAAALVAIVVVAGGDGGWRRQWWAVDDLVRGRLPFCMTGCRRREWLWWHQYGVARCRRPSRG